MKPTELQIQRRAVVRDDTKAVNCVYCDKRYDYGHPFACYSCYPKWVAYMGRGMALADDILNKLGDRERREKTNDC